MLTTRLAAAAAACFSLAALAGCGSSGSASHAPTPSSGGGSPTATPGSTLSIPSDVCRLFPMAEVTHATGLTITKSQSSPHICALQSGGAPMPSTPSLTVDAIERMANQSYSTVKANLQNGATCGGAPQIPGIGEAACIPSAMATELIWVDGGHDFGIIVASDDSSPRAHLIALAKLVESHLRG